MHMKFTITAVLFALMVISHQQLQRPRGVIWVSPYYSPPQLQPFINNYQQSPYYNDLAYLNPDSVDGNEYHQSRISGALDAQQQQNARFFFNSNRNGATITVTLTTATVQSCIPATQLAAAAGACRRKRRHVRELDDSPIPSDEDTQFPIDPSETLKVIPSSYVGAIRETRQQQLDKQTEFDRLLSSKEEVSLDDVSKADHVTNLREKRLFFNLGGLGGLGGLGNLAMMASPMTSYVFVPTTILKTVNLGASTGLLCLPAGYAKC